LPPIIFENLEPRPSGTVSFYGPVFLAGITKGIGRILARQQRSRTFLLEMQEYTEETKPLLDYRVKENVDVEASAWG
jgi:hypothetical protein